MKKTLILLIGICFLLAPNAAFSEGWNGSINALVGTKTMADDWEPVETQIQYGLIGDIAYGDTPWSFSYAFLYSSEDETDTADVTAELSEVLGVDLSSYGVLVDATADIEVTMQEICMGVRYTWQDFMDLGASKVEPYFGGGLIYIRADMTVNYTALNDIDISALGWEHRDIDAGLGLYIAGGVNFIFADSFGVGIDAKLGDAYIDYGDTVTDRIHGGGLAVAMTFGYYF